MKSFYPNSEDITTPLADMRNSEYSTVLLKTNNELEFIAVYSVRRAVVLEAVEGAVEEGSRER